MSDSLQLCGLQPTSLLCLWDAPGKNPGVGCHALLQGFFTTHGSKPPSLLHWQADSLPLSHLGSPKQADIASLLQNYYSLNEERKVGWSMVSLQYC